MDLKKLISIVRKDNSLVIEKLEELERLKRLCEVAGISYEEKISATPNPKKIEENNINLIQYKDDLTNFLNEAVIYRSRLVEIIDTLSDSREIKLMYMYCLGGRSKAYIAKQMNYTQQRIHQMYNDIVDELSQRFDEILINFNSKSDKM